MPVRQRWVVCLCLGVAIAAVGCGATKKAQCDRVQALHRQVIGLTETLTGQEPTAETALQLAADLDKLAQEMSDLNLRDPRLQELRSGFVEAYRDLSRAMQLFVQASRHAGTSLAPSEAAAAVQLLATGAKRGVELGQQAETYCLADASATPP